MANIIDIRTLSLIGCKQGHIKLDHLISDITPQSFNPSNELYY